MKLHSYIVARDYGFAPNPFFGWCTLATCKPDIRECANVGDLIIGTGSVGRSRSAKNTLTGRLVYAMKVEEILTFDQYWNDPRFQIKKPSFKSSKKYAYGDNIYHRENNEWIQSKSHHSLASGDMNAANLATDTKSEKILASRNFMYWGKEAIKIPNTFRNYNGWDICVKGRGRKVNHPGNLVTEFLAWLSQLNVKGFQSFPRDW